MTYRKATSLSASTDWWFVEMGRLDRVNGPASYPFPSEAAAFRFASAHKRIASLHTGTDLDDSVHTGVEREIAVRFPDGTRQVVELPTDLGDIDDEDA